MDRSAADKTTTPDAEAIATAADGLDAARDALADAGKAIDEAAVALGIKGTAEERQSKVTPDQHFKDVSGQR